MLRVLMFIFGFCFNPFVVAKSIDSFNCEQELNKGYPMKAEYLNGKNSRILVLVGSFAPDSHKKMRPHIRNKNYSEVWLCSGGGAVVAGQGIGKLLNEVKATVRIPAGFFCASSCTIATMGGYMRFIDEGAQFVTHASSSFAGFGFSKGKHRYFLVYDCIDQTDASVCNEVRNLLKANPNYAKAKCSNFKQVAQVSDGCTYFQSQSDPRYLEINPIFLVHFKNQSTLIRYIIQSVMQKKMSSELELLGYFQLMLVDGRQNLLNSRNYRSIEQHFKVKDLESYCKSKQCEPGFEHYLSLLSKEDIKDESSIQRVFAIWQEVLTDAELSVKEQITDYVKAHNIKLGAAQNAAINMFDAMRTCRIQSLCQLEQHNLKNLGYLNAY